MPVSYRILDEAVARHGGVRPLEQGEGDSVVAAFTRASDAVGAALQAQRELLGQWPGGIDLRVRMALHTTDAQLRDDSNYFGVGLSRCARIRAIAHGGQTLVSRATLTTWAWSQLEPWLEIRAGLPVGALLCVIHGSTSGRHWEPSAARKQLKRAAATAGVRRRFAPHQLRHAHAVEMAHEGVPLVVIQRQLGHSNLGITSIYLQGIDSAEIIDTVHARRAPMISATSGLNSTMS